MAKHWDIQLVPTIHLRNGQDLRTLRDAADHALVRWGSIRRSESVAYALLLLMQAADSGRPEDVAAATEQMQYALRSQREI